MTDTRAGAATVDYPYRHVVAGLAAAILLPLAVGAFLLYSQAHVLASSANFNPSVLNEEWRGEATPLEVLARSDLLPMYGSSELVVAMPNRVTDFFASYPTGFAVVPIGARGYPPLSMAMGIASLGGAVRNRRIVVSLSGSWFLGDQAKFDTVNFQTHFSELQAGDVIFRGALPIALRRRFAKRILSYKPLAEVDPLLGTALSCLATSCAIERFLPVLQPLWLLQSLPRRVRDYAQLDASLRGARAPAHVASSVNWDTLVSTSDSIWGLQSRGNPFGILDSIWPVAQTRLSAGHNTTTDSAFVAGMEGTAIWDDLDLLLATLQALGARPLVLSTPLKGAYWDYVGASAAARSRVYARLDSVTTRYRTPARNFGAYDADTHFLSDMRSHLSRKGWAVYDQTINAFYHDSLR
ncbi:MAG: D-alanyl-lipoteichoic acid biosynthesis protein DltD [bacterium]